MSIPSIQSDEQNHYDVDIKLKYYNHTIKIKDAEKIIHGNFFSSLFHQLQILLEKKVWVNKAAIYESVDEENKITQWIFDSIFRPKKLSNEVDYNFNEIKIYLNNIKKTQENLDNTIKKHDLLKDSLNEEKEKIKGKDEILDTKLLELENRLKKAEDENKEIELNMNTQIKYENLSNSTAILFQYLQENVKNSKSKKYEEYKEKYENDLKELILIKPFTKEKLDDFSKTKKKNDSIIIAQKAQISTNKGDKENLDDKKNEIKDKEKEINQISKQIDLKKEEKELLQKNLNDFIENQITLNKSNKMCDFLIEKAIKENQNTILNLLKKENSVPSSEALVPNDDSQAGVVPEVPPTPNDDSQAGVVPEVLPKPNDDSQAGVVPEVLPAPIHDLEESDRRAEEIKTRKLVEESKEKLLLIEKEEKRLKEFQEEAAMFSKELSERKRLEKEYNDRIIEYVEKLGEYNKLNSIQKLYNSPPTRPPEEAI